MARSFKDRFLTPPVAQAIVAPSTILAAGAGAAAGIVALGPIGGLVAGALAWTGCVLRAVPKDRRDRIDPYTLDEPWRSLVREALASQQQFHQIVRQTQVGPLADRLATIGADLDAGVIDAWKIARGGQQLATAYHMIDLTDSRARLQELSGVPDPTPTQQATRDAAEAEFATAQRIGASMARAQDQLHLLNARLGESVTRCIELSVGAASPDALNAVADQVAQVSQELEALRQAIVETSELGRSSG